MKLRRSKYAHKLISFYIGTALFSVPKLARTVFHCSQNVYNTQIEIDSSKILYHQFIHCSYETVT